MQKKGQITIFLVVGLTILGIIIIAIFLKPKFFILSVKTASKDIQLEFEECLAREINFGIINEDFTSQPNIKLAKLYLEQYMNNATLQCTSIFSNYKDLEIIDEKSKIRSIVTFSPKDVNDFNLITRIDAEVYYPIIIKKGNNQETIRKFAAGVSL